MSEKKRYGLRRVWMMLFGILLIGMCVASYHMSGFGVDAFSCMNLGVSGFLGMSFGNWQLIVNAALLAVVWLTMRRCIGLGTIVNMVCVGYAADFLCWLCLDRLGMPVTLPVRILLLALGTLFASLGCAFYMTADMGISPYDSVALIITKYTRERISFRLARVLSDVTGRGRGGFLPHVPWQHLGHRGPGHHCQRLLQRAPDPVFPGADFEACGKRGKNRLTISVSSCRICLQLEFVLQVQSGGHYEY